MTTRDSFAEAIFGQDIGQAVSLRRKNKSLQYWRKCSGTRPNGQNCSIHTQDWNWITTGPVMSPLTAIEYSEFMASKHMTPLSEYGQYEVGLVAGQDYNLSDQFSRFKAILDKGGLKEFPFDQMVAYNWHRIPLIREAFPALQEVVDIRCEHGCINRLFTKPSDYEAHCQVVHKDAEAPRAIGREFSAALDKMSGVGNVSPEMIAAIVAATVKAMNTPAPTVSLDEVSD